jgi:hypothetical protein
MFFRKARRTLRQADVTRFFDAVLKPRRYDRQAATVDRSGAS